ncbi:MAG: collagen-like protein, partial [Saprospiraceae bacterium]
MKRFIFILSMLISISGRAQSPNTGFSFQASFKEKDGKPASNKKIPLRFIILNASGKPIYTEDQSPSTDQYGIINLVIGGGAAFSKLDWSESTSLRVECDADNNGSFELLSSGPLLAGPYAGNTSSMDSLVGDKYIQVVKKKGASNNQIVEFSLKQTIFDEISSRKFLRCDSIFRLDTTPKGVIRVFDRIKCDSFKLFDDSKILDLLQGKVDAVKEIIYDEIGRRKFLRCDSTFRDTLIWQSIAGIDTLVLIRLFIGIKCDSIKLFDDSKILNLFQIGFESIQDTINNIKERILKIESLPVGIVKPANPAKGQVLKWNGSAWIADTDLTSVGTGNAATAAPLVGNGSASSPITLAPVTGTSIPQVLKWSNGAWDAAPESAGPKGDIGATGPQGIAGPQGPKGDAGDVGPQGP